MAASYPSPRPGHLIPLDDMHTTQWADNIDDLNSRLGVLELRQVCILRQTLAQGITSSTDTGVTFDAEDSDTANEHSTSTNTARYVAAAAGLRIAAGSAGCVANAAGRTELFLRKNGTGTGLCEASFINAATSASHMTVSTAVWLDAGDYLELCLFQNTGGTINTSLGRGNPRLAVYTFGTLH